MVSGGGVGEGTMGSMSVSRLGTVFIRVLLHKACQRRIRGKNGEDNLRK